MAHTESVTADTPQTRNEFSGTSDGSVVQVGTVNGGIHYREKPTVDDIGALSLAGAAKELAERHPKVVVAQLARVDVIFATRVIERLGMDQAVSLVTWMNADRLSLVLEQMTPDRAKILRDAAQAELTIEASAGEWDRLLGDPTGELCSTGPSPRGSLGYSRAYRHGVVYWNTESGVGMVSTDIADYYESQRGVSASLGFAIGSWTEAARSDFGATGHFQRFESVGDFEATVYCSDQHGTFTTWDRIGEYYEATGGTWGPLGFPVSEERRFEEFWSTLTENKCPQQGAYWQQFEGGQVFWSEKSGALRIPKAVADTYNDWPIQLGLPLEDPRPAVTSSFGTEGTLQSFARGVTYTSAPFGTVIMRGLISTYFDSQGGLGGVFGLPKSDLQSTRPARASGIVQHFEGGLIFSRHEHGAIGVIGPIAAALGVVPKLPDQLGLPTGSERRIGFGPDVIQFFDGGIMTVVNGKVERWIRPTDQQPPS